MYLYDIIYIYIIYIYLININIIINKRIKNIKKNIYKSLSLLYIKKQTMVNPLQQSNNLKYIIFINLFYHINTAPY